MKKYFLSAISCILISSGCASNKTEKIEVHDVPAVKADEAFSNVPEEIKIPQAEEKIEIAGTPPYAAGEKFKVDDDKLISDEIQLKPVMIAVVAPMSGKYEMLGNAIMDGAHIGLVELFNKHKIPVRLTAVDTGSSIEEIEFNISKLDESEFDIILGLTSEDQQAFVEAYIANDKHKPLVLSLLPKHCAISLQDQIKMLDTEGKLTYLVSSMPEASLKAQNPNIKIFQYSTVNVQHTNNDLEKIAVKIEEETRGKHATVIFTDANWKLQKFVASLDNLKIRDRLQVVLASLSNLNGRMQTVNEKRHKFGDIAVISLEQSDYTKFMREFHRVNNRKPLELSFLAYNIIQKLKNSSFNGNSWSFDAIKNNCKPELKLFDKNAKHYS